MRSQIGQSLIETLASTALVIILISFLLTLIHREGLRKLTRFAVHEALICEQTLKHFNCRKRLTQFCSKISFGLKSVVKHPNDYEYVVFYYLSDKKLYLKIQERFFK